MMAAIRQIFLSPDEPRLRAGWRVLAQLAIWVALTILLALPAAVILFLVPDSFNALNVALNALTILPSVWLARRYIDRRSITSLGLRRDRQAVRDLLVGIGIAALMMAAVVLIQVQAGWLRFSGTAGEQRGWLELVGGLVWWALLFAAVGFYEELLSRGYQLQNLEEGGSLVLGVVVSSGFFGLMHILNPEATWVSTLGVAVSGVFFAFAYLRTRQLWLPIGIHIGWNYFEGPVFGFPVSGMQTTSLLEHTVSGPAAWTGGSFGPEAGLVLLPGLLVGAVLVAVYTRGRSTKREAGG